MSDDAIRKAHFEQQHARHKLGDAPIEEAYYQQMNALAEGLDEWFNGEAKGANKKVGFVLLAFPFGKPKEHCNFISNADPRDIVRLFREVVARFEGQPEMKGGVSVYDKTQVPTT